ncbi:MAG: histone-like protein [Candidatus Aenigmatarchaeota archaeon]
MFEGIRLKSMQKKEEYKIKKKKGDVLPIFTVMRMAKKFGAERISKGGAEMISKYLSEEFRELVGDADRFCRHAGRKTVMAEDVQMAIEGRKKR